MGHFVLLLLTLNATTGEPSRYEVVSRAYDTEESCLQAALERGPQPRIGSDVTVFSCKATRDEISI